MSTMHSLRMLCFERNEKIMDLERHIEHLENVIKMVVLSQGWDGNNDERWSKLYDSARACLKRNQQPTTTERRTGEMNEQSERVEVASDTLLNLFRRLLGLRLCIGNRWKCDNGHEWVTAHCDATWFWPTTCPECGQTATAHRGEWQTLREWSSDKAHSCPKRYAPGNCSANQSKGEKA